MQGIHFKHLKNCAFPSTILLLTTLYIHTHIHTYIYTYAGYSLQALEELCIPIDHPSVNTIRAKFMRSVEKIKQNEEAEKFLDEEKVHIHTYMLHVCMYVCMYVRISILRRFCVERIKQNESSWTKRRSIYTNICCMCVCMYVCMCASHAYT